MFFNLTRKAACSLALLMFVTVPSVLKEVQANESKNLPTLTIKPSKCVSMQQGQVCYVDVLVTWQVSEVGDYCLNSSLQGAPLQCWSAIKQGEFSQQIEITADVEYSLTETSSEQVIIKSVLPLAWVHKREKFSHSSWRIF